MKMLCQGRDGLKLVQGTSKVGMPGQSHGGRSGEQALEALRHCT